MPFFQRVATALALAGAFAPSVGAQVPATPSAQPRSNTAVVARPKPVAPTQAPAFRRSVVHHNPYPYPNFYESDETAGFRNPGGVGHFREYYPVGNQFQAGREQDPVRVARFDQGGGAPDRAEQLQAEALGIAKYNSIQGHIDNYARPFYGYGFGVGAFGGFY